MKVAMALANYSRLQKHLPRNCCDFCLVRTFEFEKKLNGKNRSLPLEEKSAVSIVDDQSEG